MDEPSFRLRGSDFSFKPLGGPLDNDPENAWFAAWGRAAAEFARMEHMLAVLVIHINKEAASKVLYEPNPSNSFKALIVILRKWLAEHPDFEAFKDVDEDEKFFDALNEISDRRNDIAHGLLLSVEDGSFKLARIKKAGKDEWRTSVKIFDASMPASIAKLSGIATRHLVEIAKTVFPHEDDQSRPPQTV